MKCPKCGEDDINGPFCCGYKPKGKKKVMTPTPQKFVDEVESLSAILHEIYMKEAERQGDVRHDWDYSKLKESTKEYDRVLARYILEREALAIQTSYDKGVREGLNGKAEAVCAALRIENKACAKVADQAVIDGGVDAQWIADKIRQRSSK